MIKLPGDDELIAKVEAGQELTENEAKRVELLTRDKIIEAIGKDKISEISDSINKSPSLEFVRGFKEGVGTLINGIFNAPIYTVKSSNGENGQEEPTVHGVIPYEYIQALQQDITVLTIAYENKLSYDDFEELMNG